jgi:phenylacetate-coenzyme A ligase PaaK-like adenylate-forming protein
MTISRLARLMSVYVGAVRRFRGLRGDGLARYQDARARDTVAYAIRHSPFYREHFRGRDPADWASLPTVDKAAMMDRFDAFNTRGIRREEAMSVALRAERDGDVSPTLGGVTVGLSSGTSGRRGLFLMSAEESATWAGFILARALPRPRWGGYRIALFLRANSDLYEGLGGRWVRFRYFDLRTPPAATVEALNEYQPHLLVGPPSVLVGLAEALRHGDLWIRPERVAAAAEVLEPQDREALAGAFDRPIHQVYQATEGLLALSCPRGSLHVQEDLVALQFEPADPLGDGAEGRLIPDRPNDLSLVGWGGTPPEEARAGGVPPHPTKDHAEKGQGSRQSSMTPIVTDLWRRTQPIIRYRLGDLVTLSGDPCPCGSAFRVLAGIEGRSEDACRLVCRDGSHRSVFPETVRQMVLLGGTRVEDYDVLQEGPGHFRLHLRMADGEDFREAEGPIRGAFSRLASRLGCEEPILRIEEGLLPRSPGEKRQRVRRLRHAGDP